MTVDDLEGRHSQPMPRACRSRMRRRVGTALGLVLMVALLGGCGCRPGYVGPYGGVHPARCWFG